MQNLHLTPDDADDIYSGYDYQSIANELEEDPEFQRVIKTGYAQRPPIPTMAGMAPPTTAGLRTGARPTTGVAPDTGQARPMTGVTAANFTSSTKGQKFDPLNQSSAVKSSTATQDKGEANPQDVIKKLEKAVNVLIEESATASAMGDYQTALDKAKDAARKERMLCKQRKQAQLTDQINFDLTYCVLFNLGSQYHACKNYRDALNTYLLIVKDKMFSTAGRLRVNMGNIYMEQGQYPQAIKMYRMALDQISDIHKDVRFKIMQNIGTVFVCMGRYADAITSFETIMEEQANFKTALNLMLCYYAISDRDKLKKTFHRTLQISTGVEDEDRYYPTMDDDPEQRLLIEAIKDDSLRKIEKERKTLAEKTILTAAKLIAPVIESSFAVGFDWCIERVKESMYSELASELEITKALTYLRQNEVSKAIETFKDCGKKDSKMAGTAATNLSFVYIMEDTTLQADKYADSAISLDRYNASALVNKGCCLYRTGQYEKSVEYFREALSVEATCSQALYNLGLVYKRLGRHQDALNTFLKLHTILKNSPEVMWHLGDLYDRVDDFNQATEWELVGYDMTSNPSYGTSVATSDYTAGKTYLPSSVISFSNPMYNNYAALGGAGAGSSAYKKRTYQSTGVTAASGGGEREVGQSHYGTEGRSHYLEAGGLSASKKYGNRDLLEANVDPPGTSAPPTEPSSETSRNYKLLEARVGSSRSEAGLGVGLGAGPSHSSSSSSSSGTKTAAASSSQEVVTGTRSSSRSHHHHHHHHTSTGTAGGVAAGEGAGQRGEELERRLEEVTQERDTLRAQEANHERVHATLQRRIKRLEQQLAGEEVEPSGEELEALRKEIGEMRDQNTALKVQIKEYADTMMDHNKGMDAKELLDITKRHQLEQVEALARMKSETEKAMKVYEECLHLTQTNVSLTSEMHDYRERNKVFLEEIRQKDREIEQLRHSLADKDSDRLALELQSMQEKCDGWREEVERLMPLEEEVRRLRRENKELGQQMTMMVEEVEKKREEEEEEEEEGERGGAETAASRVGRRGGGGGGGGAGNVLDYDGLARRLEELQDVRVSMEEEIRTLREERASILRENAALREGSEPQRYMQLKAEHEAVLQHLRQNELALGEEQRLKEELHTANSELHQKLVTATDPEVLRSVQDRVGRYRSERDQAKAELESTQAQLATLEAELASARAAASGRGGELDRYKQLLEGRGEEVARLKREMQRLEAKMLRYREERNKEKENVRSLRQQLKELAAAQQQDTPLLPPPLPSASTAAAGAGISGQDGAGGGGGGVIRLVTREASHSPSHDLHYNTETSPTSELPPPPSAFAGEQQHQQLDCDTPEEGTVSPTYKYHAKIPETYSTKFSSKTSELSSGIFNSVTVLTKDGKVQMEVQKPSAQLNPKHKPQVVVRRESGYETGTLMFVGTIGGKELAGVQMDVRVAPKPSSTNPYDGTFPKDGKRYFKCPTGFGAYVPLSRIYIEVESATV